MNAEAIESTVQSLQWIYTVVVALAIGEAIGRVVGDNNSSGDRRIQWNRIAALISFVFIVVPFYHGMGRYLQTVYDPTSPPSAFGWSYGIFLLLDVAVFGMEAFLFFVLARSLAPSDWRRFYGAVLFLLGLDILWGAFVWAIHTNSIKWWVVVNVVTWPVLFLLLCARIDKGRSWFVYAPVIILLRTVYDYSLTWSFYFP